MPAQRLKLTLALIALAAGFALTQVQLPAQAEPTQRSSILNLALASGEKANAVLSRRPLSILRPDVVAKSAPQTHLVSRAPRPLGPAPKTTKLAGAQKAPTGNANSPALAPKTVLLRSGNWVVYPFGCKSVSSQIDVVIHFHGVHTTVIPRYLSSRLGAMLVIVNKGIGSGAYSEPLAFRGAVDGLLSRIRKLAAKHCNRPEPTIARLAISSWSAGYGATEQFLRFRPELVDAVLLADGLHVGFSDRRRRTVNLARLEPFAKFARRASRGQALMAITHSAILPGAYAGTSETARALSAIARAAITPASKQVNGMQQLTAAHRGEFYVEGFAGKDKAAHARHLYSIGKTSFARLKQYWSP